MQLFYLFLRLIIFKVVKCTVFPRDTRIEKEVSEVAVEVTPRLTTAAIYEALIKLE